MTAHLSRPFPVADNSNPSHSRPRPSPVSPARTCHISRRRWLERGHISTLTSQPVGVSHGHSRTTSRPLAAPRPSSSTNRHKHDNQDNQPAIRAQAPGPSPSHGRGVQGVPHLLGNLFPHSARKRNPIARSALRQPSHTHRTPLHPVTFFYYLVGTQTPALSSSFGPLWPPSLPPDSMLTCNMLLRAQAPSLFPAPFRANHPPRRRARLCTMAPRCDAHGPVRHGPVR